TPGENLEWNPPPILPKKPFDVPPPHPDATSEKIQAPASSPIQRPADPILFPEKVSPAAASPSLESPHRVEAPPRRQKWSSLLKDSPAQDAPPIQKTADEVPRRAVGSTYI